MTDEIEAGTAIASTEITFCRSSGRYACHLVECVYATQTLTAAIFEFYYYVVSRKC